MPFKKRNLGRDARWREKQNQIEMVRFLSREFVVQSKKKVSGVLLYSIIGAIGTDVQGVRFANVPYSIIVKYANDADRHSFGEMRNQFGK